MSRASRKFFLIVATLLLWVMTIILCAYSVKVFLDTGIFILQAMLLLGLITDKVIVAGLMSSTTWVVLVIGGIIWLVVTVGGVEYHLKRVGRPESWRLFVWTIGLALIPIILSFVIPQVIFWFV